MRKLVLALAAFLSVQPLVRSYGSGPPNTVCESMRPDPGVHGTAQSSTVPFKLEPSRTSVQGGDSLTLTLSKTSSASPDFEGFMIEGVDATTGRVMGSFRIPSGSTELKGMTCNGIQAGAVSHRNKGRKMTVTVEWVAPSVPGGQTKTVSFYFTVVQTLNTFWDRKPATSNVAVTAGSGEPVPEPKSDVQDLPVFSECGSQMGCFGAPADCNVKKGGCELVAAYARVQAEGKYKFEVMKKAMRTGEYAALGISEDNRMGGDLVFACFSDPSGSGNRLVDVRWNSGKNNIGKINGVTLEDVVVRNEDGYTVCSFEVAQKLRFTPESAPVELNFVDKHYNVLLATGEMGGGSNLQYHSFKAASQESLNLASTSVVGAEEESTSLIKGHGCLMVIAWIGFAACGKMFPLYYRLTFRSVKLGGKDLWFRAHQIFMGSTVFFTLIGLILICAAEGAWPYTRAFIRQNPHPATGLVCILLAFIQPAMAFFRPHPGTKRRPIFNWVHKIFGNTAFILSFATMFLAANLSEARLTWSYTSVLIVVIVMYVVTHIALTLQTVYTGMKNGGLKIGASNSVPMDTVNGHPVAPQPHDAPADPEEDAPGSLFRKVVMLLSLTLNWCCVIALLVYIGRGSG